MERTTIRMPKPMWKFLLCIGFVFAFRTTALADKTDLQIELGPVTIQSVFTIDQ